MSKAPLQGAEDGAAASSAASPRVSVIMATYNHEPYVGEALASAVMQDTSFPFEILVGEDASTDATRAVVAEYERRYPALVRPRYRQQNIGGRANFIDLLGAARGDLIALLEGDDRWLTVEKLQRQVDLLDARPEASGCFHNVRWRIESQGAAIQERASLGRERVTLPELFEKNLAATCSVMLRRRCIVPLPPWIWKVPMADWPILMLAAAHGDLLYIDEVMGEYRLQPQGAWTRRTESERLEADIVLLRTVDAHFEGRFTAAIASQVARRHLAMAEERLATGDRGNARRHLSLAFSERRRAGLPVLATMDEHKLAARVLAPRTFAALRRLRRWRHGGE